MLSLAPSHLPNRLMMFCPSAVALGRSSGQKQQVRRGGGTRREGAEVARRVTRSNPRTHRFTEINLLLTSDHRRAHFQNIHTVLSTSHHREVIQASIQAVSHCIFFWMLLFRMQNIPECSILHTTSLPSAFLFHSPFSFLLLLFYELLRFEPWRAGQRN